MKKIIFNFLVILLLPMLMQAAQLIQAVQSGNMQRVEQLLSERNSDGTKRYDVNYRARVLFRNSFGFEVGVGFPLLYYAVQNKHLFMLHKLLAAGANVNAANHVNKRTSLHSAACIGADGCVEALIAAQADINSRDNKGDTPLHCAACFDNVDCFALLMAAGADLNIRNYKRETALDLVQSKDKSIRKLLTIFNVSCYVKEKISLFGQAIIKAHDAYSSSEDITTLPEILWGKQCHASMKERTQSMFNPEYLR
jgi:hypothetical protein